MDIIVGGEDVKAAKPSPEGLLLAIKRLHVSKAETLYIGDSTVDAETAQAAGVDFAGVTHGVTTAKGKCACHFSPETEKDKRLANPPSSDTLLAGY